MAIDLLNRLSGQINKVQNKEVTVVANADNAEVARVLRSVYALKSGDTLQGELLSVNGNDLSLLLGNAVVLNAKTEKNLILQPGQMMNFTVSSNHNGKLSLQPLFTNTGLEQNAMKALDAAGIPVTEKSLSLAEEMMKQGLPVNKQTLQTMFRHVSFFPDAQIDDLVMLQKMNMPINEQNINMMHLYQSNQQYLFEDMQGLAQEISTFVADVVQSGNSDLVNSFVRGLLNVFQVNHEMIEGKILENPVATDAAMQNTAVNPEKVSDLNSDKNLILQSNVADTDVEENSVKTDNKQVHEQQKGLKIAQELEKEVADLERLLSDRKLDGSSSRQELTNTLLSLLKNHFLMKPEEFNGEESVKQFYEKLQLQIEQLEQLVKATGKEDSSLAKNISTVKSNIQFMNQLNQMYHYVQLPLNVNQHVASGDLYVFKRKHAKTDEDGKLTALLHLTMPTLGNMDVFLSLQNQNLTTKFCMEKEELIDFMEAHMEQLNERLRKKGYIIQTSVITGTQEEKTVIENIMKSESKLPVFSDVSFDARC